MKQEAALILLVDDDDDDCEIIQKGFAKNGIANEFRCFPNGLEALQFLKNTSSQIFLILSDVNMPLMNGLEFKKAINNDTELCERSIPFIFLSTAANTYLISEANKLSAQGYFQKPSSMTAIGSIVRTIFDYWYNNKLISLVK